MFLAKFDLSTPIGFSKSVYVAELDKSNSTFTFSPKNLVLENIHSFMICLYYLSSIKQTTVSFSFST